MWPLQWLPNSSSCFSPSRGFVYQKASEHSTWTRSTRGISNYSLNRTQSLCHCLSCSGPEFGSLLWPWIISSLSPHTSHLVCFLFHIQARLITMSFLPPAVSDIGFLLFHGQVVSTSLLSAQVMHLQRRRASLTNNLCTLPCHNSDTYSTSSWVRQHLPQARHHWSVLIFTMPAKDIDKSSVFYSKRLRAERFWIF